MSKKSHPSAFEIRFNNSELEVHEIPPSPASQVVPEAFKTRDKIPRSSGSIEEQLNHTNNNNNNIQVPSRSDSQNSSIGLTFKSHHGDSSKKGISTNTDQISTIKVKSSNAVGPAEDKQQQQQRINSGGKNFNFERPSSFGNNNNNLNDLITNSVDDTIIRNSNKKQRSIKVDEIEKEKSNLGKTLHNHQIMDSNNNNKKIMQKNRKNSKSITNTNNIIHKDEENKSLPKDGIATPPDTPPSSPQLTSQQKRSENEIIMDESSQLVTPPSDSTEFNDDYVSTQSKSRVTRPSKRSQSSRKRKGSQSPQKSQSMLSTKRSIEIETNTYQPPRKLSHPRGRRLSSSSNQFIVTDQSQESIITQSSNNSKEIQKQQSQPIPTRSRIPRLSISSKERPIIDKKLSQSSISSQGSNKFNGDSKELLASYPLVSKFDQQRNLRLVTSRPIINTSIVPDEDEVIISESPTDYSSTNNNSPTSHSPTSLSQTNHLQSSHSAQQKKFVSHDDVIIPTIAKKLKMNGQLPLVNHDALLGYSEEQEVILPASENGYMDITDLVEDLFDKDKFHKSNKQSSIPNSQRRRQRKDSSSDSTGHSRNASKTHYIAPRKQPPQQTHEELPSTKNAQLENSSEQSTHNNGLRSKRGRLRREEYIISVREDDNDVEFIEPPFPMSLNPSEPFTAPTVQVEKVESNDQIIYQEKIEEPAPVQIQIPVVQEAEYIPNPEEIVISAPIVTDGKKKKDKKKKQKKGNGDLDEEDIYVRKSKCRCAIQ